MNRTRPALLLVTASLIPVIILAAVMGWFFIREQQKNLDDSVRGRAATLAGVLQRELNSQMQLLAIVAESPRLDPPIVRSAFSELARRLRERVPEWEQIRVSDLEGTVVLAVPPVQGSKRVVEIESHETAVRTAAPVIGNVAMGPRDQPAFPIRVPVIRKDKTRAILSVVMRPTVVTNLLYSSGLPETWTAYVVDGQDRLVASTGSPALAGKPATEFAAFSGGSFGSATTTSGATLQMAEVPLDTIPWRVRIGLPLAEYERLARNATMLIAVASLCTILLFGSAAFLFQREVRARNRERESMANWQRMDALGKLTGQAAHDFNNLLMVFQSGVEGIKRRRHDEQRVNQMLSHMSEGVTRGKAITQRLLSFSRRSNQGATTVELDLKLAELAPLLRQAVNDTVVMDIKLPDDIWPIHVDPAGLEIALINLLTNARDALGSGGHVTISARNVPDGKAEVPTLHGSFVALTVSDTGRGIAPDDLGRVFEPFFSTKNNNGTGLGLTQVHSFAQGSGGAVKVTSVVGHGSAFTLLLPKSNEQRIPTDDTRQSLDLPQTILVVDDTPSSLESVRLALEELVANVITASSGREALDILEHQPGIEALVSDIMMPGMSGIELADEASRRHRRLPIVLMTGYSDKLEAGAEIGRPVVGKPFKVEDLASALGAAKAAIAEPVNVIRLERPAKS